MNMEFWVVCDNLFLPVNDNTPTFWIKKKKKNGELLCFVWYGMKSSTILQAGKGRTDEKGVHFLWGYVHIYTILFLNYWHRGRDSDKEYDYVKTLFSGGELHMRWVEHSWDNRRQNRESFESGYVLSRNYNNWFLKDYKWRGTN